MDLAGSQESSEEKPRSPPQQQPHPHPYPHPQPHPTIMPAPTPTPVPTPTAMPPPPTAALLAFSSAAAAVATPNFPVLAAAPAATVSSQQEPKLKLATSGNGGASPLQQQQAAEAREILRLNAPQQQQQQQTAASSAKIGRPGLVRYRECQRNHAASMGGHALDGCGEFMPGGPDGSPDALKCAACDCHRNFHRPEAEGEPPLCECRRAKRPALALAGPSSLGGGVGIPQQQQQQLVAASPATPATAMTMTTLALATPATAMQYQQARGPAMALSGGPASSDEQEGGMSAHGGSPSAMKKRFRTKFTGEQKDKMCAFADKLGWRMQKHDEAAVQEFCASVGVKRHVLKVWMHNNKHTLGKKP